MMDTRDKLNKEPERFGLYLTRGWDVETAINALVWIANGAMPWYQWQQHPTDTRGIVCERAANAVREALKTKTP